MPAVSKAQQQLFAIAEHQPSKLKENGSLKKLGRKELHKFAATPTKNLPEHVGMGRRTSAGKK